MQIDIVSESSFARKVNVVVPASDVSSALDRAFATAARNARLPGFRPGKVPLKVLEARFGASIAGDVAGDLIQAGWTRIMTDKSLEPVSQPSVVDRGELVRGADFSFVIGVEVKPEITVQGYEGLAVEWPEWAVEDASVEATIERRREGQSRLVSVEGRPVTAGDTVQVEVSGKDGDEVVFQEPGTLVRTVGETWLKGLGPALVGLAIDESRTSDVTFADDALNTDVAGRTLSVTVKVLSIQAMEAPALDDELAKELGHDSVDAFREAVKAELTAGREDQSRNQARANLLEALIEANPFEVPVGMIQQNVEMLQQELTLQRAYQGADPRQVRFSQAELADLRVRAVFATRGALLLEAVSTSESLDVTDAEVDARIEEMAAERGQSAEAIRGYFQRDGAIEDLKERLLEEKTLDWLLDRAVVTKVDGAAKQAEAIAEAAAAEPAEEAAPKSKAKAKAKAEPAAPAPVEAAAPAPAKKKASYKTIDGVRYARDLLETAEAAGDTIDLATIQGIVASAMDGKGMTDVERRTIARIRDTATLAADAKAWLAKNADLD